MSVLVCDSNCELWYTRARELNLDYISMPYTYGGNEYSYDLGEKTDFKAFYTAVRGGEVPKTMALNPEDYKAFLRRYFEKGEDVLYVSFSHAMSGTFTQLSKALDDLKTEFPARTCTVFNTNSICLGAGIQAEAAAMLKNSGASDDEIIKFLEQFTHRIALYFAVDDLMHLKRGGRLSATSAVAGTLMNIKPVLTINSEGSLNVYQKVIGRKKALRTIAEKVATELTGTEYSVYVVDADCPADGDELAELIAKRRPEAKIVRQPIGPVIGTHCGPGTFGVIFVADKRPIPLGIKADKFLRSNK